MPELPDDSISELVRVYGLTLKDAKTLVEIDDGARLDYYDEVLECLGCSHSVLATPAGSDNVREEKSAWQQKLAKTAANWCTIILAMTSSCKS